MTPAPNGWTFSIGWKASSRKINNSNVNHNKAGMRTARYGMNFGTPFTKIQGTSKQQGRHLEKVEYSLNQAELAHRTHAERLATVESQVRNEAKGRRSELQ